VGAPPPGYPQACPPLRSTPPSPYKSFTKIQNYLQLCKLFYICFLSQYHIYDGLRYIILFSKLVLRDAPLVIFTSYFFCLLQSKLTLCKTTTPAIFSFKWINTHFLIFLVQTLNVQWLSSSPLYPHHCACSYFSKCKL